MGIVRTIVWVLITIVLVVFSFGNWEKKVEVAIWFGLIWDTRLPALVIVAFLLGMVPTWLVHRAARWRLKRRIASLEAATARATLPIAEPTPPLPAEPPV